MARMTWLILVTPFLGRNLPKRRRSSFAQPAARGHGWCFACETHYVFIERIGPPPVIAAQT